MRITKLTAKKILKEVGAERVSDDAAVEFADTINEFSYKIANKAVKLAAHAKRATIKKSDVELAV